MDSWNELQTFHMSKMGRIWRVWRSDVDSRKDALLLDHPALVGFFIIFFHFFDLTVHRHLDKLDTVTIDYNVLYEFQVSFPREADIREEAWISEYITERVDLRISRFLELDVIKGDIRIEMEYLRVVFTGLTEINSEAYVVINNVTEVMGN